MSTPSATERPQAPSAPPPAVGPTGEVPPSPGGMPTRPGSMSGMGMSTGGVPAERPSIPVASYRDYGDAQRAVDFLSDRGFPVQNTAIVGTDLHLVEQVTGRMTTGKAALSGAGAGAWIGLLIGLLLGVFAVGGWLAVVVTAVILGAIWGSILGAITHAMTRGQRDFSSRSRLEASDYAVTVTPPLADQARDQLAGMNWR